MYFLVICEHLMLLSRYYACNIWSFGTCEQLNAFCVVHLAFVKQLNAFCVVHLAFVKQLNAHLALVNNSMLLSILCQETMLICQETMHKLGWAYQIFFTKTPDDGVMYLG